MVYHLESIPFFGDPNNPIDNRCQTIGKVAFSMGFCGAGYCGLTWVVAQSPIANTLQRWKAAGHTRLANFFWIPAPKNALQIWRQGIASPNGNPDEEVPQKGQDLG